MEAQRIGEVLPSVMQNIRRRCELNPANKDFQSGEDTHTERVWAAVGDFMSGKSGRPKGGE